MAGNEQKLIILMAEDDNDYYMVAKEVFEQLRIINELRHVENGEEAMDYLLRRGKYQDPKDSPRPGLIFLDLNMPKKNGLETLKEIKARPDLSHIPVFILTVSTDDKDILQSYQSGVSSFITKPFTFDGLIKALSTFQEYWFEIVKLPIEHRSKH